MLLSFSKASEAANFALLHFLIDLIPEFNIMFLSKDLISISTFVALATAQSITVNTNFGSVNGVKCANSNSKSFLSIPYANPPIGSLRFAAPQPYNGTFPPGGLNASTKPPACIQFGSEFVEPLPWSEDW
jgi:hypothetical protein